MGKGGLGPGLEGGALYVQPTAVADFPLLFACTRHRAERRCLHLLNYTEKNSTAEAYIMGHSLERFLHIFLNKNSLQRSCFCLENVTFFLGYIFLFFNLKFIKKLKLS